MADRDLTELCPQLQALYPKLIAACAAQNIHIKAIVTWRSPAEQDAVKQQGLSNACAGESPHNHIDSNNNPCSLAIDVGIFEDDGAYVTNGKDPRYMTMGSVAEGLGLSWGGRWHHPDWDHVELKNWKQYVQEV